MRRRLRAAARSVERSCSCHQVGDREALLCEESVRRSTRRVARYAQSSEADGEALLGQHLGDDRAETRADVVVLVGQQLAHAAGDIDLVFRGLFEGERRSYLFDVSSGLYQADSQGAGDESRSGLLNHAQAGRLEGCLIGVSPGEGARFGRDRDSDGTLDGDEGLESYELGTGCDATLTLTGNSAPELGNDGFALVIEGGTPGAEGFLLVAPGVSVTPGTPGAIALQRDPAVSTSSFQFDVRGAAVISVPIPNQQAYIGRTYQVRALGRSSCGDVGRVGSNGLHITVMP